VFVCVCVCRYCECVSAGAVDREWNGRELNIAYHSVYIILTTALTLLNQHAPIGSKECVIEHRCTMKCHVHLRIRIEINI